MPLLFVFLRPPPPRPTGINANEEMDDLAADKTRRIINVVPMRKLFQIINVLPTFAVDDCRF